MKQILIGLDRIQALACRMIDEDQADVDRAMGFAAIKVIVDSLEEINDDLNDGNANASSLIGDILSHSRSIANLDDGNGHQDNQHMSWLRRAIQGVKSDLALGPYIEE